MSLNVTNPMDLLLVLLNCFEKERVYLPAGEYVLEFATKSTPTIVWIAELDSNGVQVCQGGVNTFGVQIVPDGFVLVANVESEFTEIVWQAVLSNPALNS